MRKIGTGHYISEKEGINVYRIEKRVCTDKVRKSGRTFADYRTNRYWNFTLRSRDGVWQGYGSKQQALAAAREILNRSN